MAVKIESGSNEIHQNFLNSLYNGVLNRNELKCSGGWSTGTVDWLSASERGQYLDGCPAMNTKCLVPLPFLPDLTLQWRHNGSDSVWNHQPHDCLLNRLFGHRSKKTSKLRVTGLCVGNSPKTGEFPAQMASNAANVSIWWRHHDTLVYWEPFLWPTNVGTTRNTVIRLGWSRIGLTVLILHATGVGLTDRPSVISGRYNKYHSLQLQNYYANFSPLQHTHIHAKHNYYAELVMGVIMGFEALYAGRGRRNPVWSGKEALWSLRGLIVKSAEQCGADYKPLDR